MKGGGLALVRLAGQGAQVVLTAGTLVVLARLLEPADFGLVALATAWLGVLGGLRDFGLPLAVAQRREVTAPDLTGLFRHLTKLQLWLAVGAAVSAPLVARGYGESRLTAVLWVLAGATLVLSSAALSRALLVRGLRFGTLAAVEVAGVAVGATLAVGTGLAGWGYWALVVFHVGRSAVTAVLLWWRAGWRPRGPATPAAELADSRGYGRRLTWARLVRQAGRHADRLVLGFFVGVTPLGFYSQAHRWSTQPAQQIQAPLVDLMVAVLARRVGEPGRFAALFCQASRAVSVLVLPVLAGLVALAGPAVALLLGPGWDEVVPLLRVLAAAAFLTALRAPFKWLFLASGRTAEHLKVTAVVAVVSIVAVSATAPFGVTAVAWGLLAVAGLVAPWVGWLALAGSPVSGRRWLGAVAAPVGAAVLAAGVVWLPGVAEMHPVVRFGVFGVVDLLGLVVLAGGPGRLWRGMGVLLEDLSFGERGERGERGEAGG